jgi:uncharacterized protein (DUF1330 family)
MSACVIGHITVKDAEKWAQYRAQVPATLAPWGAELLFRGQTAAVLPAGIRTPTPSSSAFPMRQCGRTAGTTPRLPGADPAA